MQDTKRKVYLSTLQVEECAPDPASTLSFVEPHHEETGAPRPRAHCCYRRLAREDIRAQVEPPCPPGPAIPREEVATHPTIRPHSIETHCTLREAQGRYLRSGTEH